MPVIEFFISFFGKLVVVTGLISAVITIIEILRYSTGGKDGRL